MKIKYHKRFKKQFKKLSAREKQKVVFTINKFITDPHDKILRNHQLKGSLKDLHSISAGPDLRIIFEEFDNYALVVFLDLGKHNRVYK